MMQVTHSNNLGSIGTFQSNRANLLQFLQFEDPAVRAVAIQNLSAYGPSAQSPYLDCDGHIMFVVKMAQILANRVEAEGIRVNRKVLLLAVLGHHALFGADPSAFGCKSNQELAALYSGRILKNLMIEDSEIEQVCQAIRATSFAVSPQTVEARILRAVNLSTIAGFYEQFRSCSELLFQESRARGGDKPFASFGKESLQYLALYLADMISLTPHVRDQDGRSVWHSRAMSNICQLYCEICPPHDEVSPGRAIHLFLGDATESTVFNERSLKSKLRLAIELIDEETLRIPEMPLSREETFSNSDIVMKIPGTSMAIPLPDGACDAIFVNWVTPISVGELNRVCNANGTIVMRYDDVSPLAGTLEAFSRIGLNVIEGFTDEKGGVFVLRKKRASIS